MEADTLQIAEMRDLLDAATSEDEMEEYESPSDKFSSHQGFIFGYSSLKVDLKSLHPSPSQIFILWEVFKENVDPVVKLLHRPTAKNILINAATSVDKVSKPAEALLFAIYLGAVVSLTEDQCMQLLGEKKSELMKKYRFATEQALARADFLNSSSLMCLQAFVFFLVFVRHMDDSRLVWALGGLAIHLAQALGIHRDGSNFAITPFDIEMRRRLWWHISILDNRSSEDHGTDPTFTESFYDTKLPLNVNDDDIYPEMTHAPNERPGATEMTFCLIRFELNVALRRLNLTSPGITNMNSACLQSFEDKEKMIDACHRKIEEKYLQYCDMSVPIFWVSATVARLILAKMWLMVHHPRSFMMDHNGQSLPGEIKDRLFVTSIEVIEFSYLLERNENTAKWGWLFRTYMQWQSVAFVLSEICVRSPGVEVDRAWRAIESVYHDHFVRGKEKNHKGMLWRPMRHLMSKARAVRAKQVREGKAQPFPKELSSFGQRAGSVSSDSVDGMGGQQPFDFQADPWHMHIGDQDNMMGAAAEAFGMEFDLESLKSPITVSSDGSTLQQKQQSQQKPIPRAMSSVYGKQQQQQQQSQPQQSQPEQMQGIVMPQSASPTLSVNSDFNIPNNNMSPSFDPASSISGPGLPAAAGNMSSTDGMNFNSPDFLNWSSWNPGVGDFNVAPQIPISNDPLGGFWSANMVAMGPAGGTTGREEWY